MPAKPSHRLDLAVLLPPWELALRAERKSPQLDNKVVEPLTEDQLKALLKACVGSLRGLLSVVAVSAATPLRRP